MTNELIVAIIFGTITIIFMALQLLFPKPIADYGNKLLSNKEKIMNKAGRIIFTLFGYAFPILASVMLLLSDHWIKYLLLL